jgi:hypothetical protein
MDNLIDLFNRLRITEPLDTQCSTRVSFETSVSQNRTELHSEVITAFPPLYQHHSPSISAPNTELLDTISDHVASTWIPLPMPIHLLLDAFMLPPPQTTVLTEPSQFPLDGWVQDPNSWEVANVANEGYAAASHAFEMPNYNICGASVPPLSNPTFYPGNGEMYHPLVKEPIDSRWGHSTKPEGQSISSVSSGGM